MKILVIGSKGFIGKHVYNAFRCNPGCTTYSCDVVVDYTTVNYVQIDATNADFTALFIQIKFDVCINCSGAASVPDSLLNPHRDFLLNTYNVFKLLDAVRKFNSGCKVVNISSAAVYGNPVSLPIKENNDTVPISPYGHHKLMSETICREFFDYYGLKTCSLRIFSAYGEGLKKQILWDLANKMCRNSEIKLFGTGTETRDFIYIQDIVAAINIIIQNAQFRGEAINVANGREVKISEIVQLFRRKIEWNGSVCFTGEAREGDPKNWKADISLLRSYGYKPAVTLERGVSNYITWVKENI